MYLITSAAYIASELQSEFGLLPPSFLPLGNKRLFHHQLELIPSVERTILTLPEGFKPGPYDSQFLAENNIELLFLPVHLNLGESIVYALNLIEFNSQEPLYMLHGDTLLNQLPVGVDILGLSQVEDNYDWAEYQSETGLLSNNANDGVPIGNLISNGYFSFSSPKSLIKHIVLAKWDFISGLNRYQKEKKLTPSLCTDWFDFGHSHTYYHSKSKMTTQRAFNEMNINRQIVTKLSSKKFKLAAEANWYRSIPMQLKYYTPQLLNTEEHDTYFGYSIEYLHLTALNELYVFSQLPAFAWRKILKACFKFLNDTKQYKSEYKKTLASLFGNKTFERLYDFAKTAPFDIEQPLTINGKTQLSLKQLAEISLKFLPSDNAEITVLHGDFCFSNILYDFRTCNIKVIDPRGIDASNTPTIYGNNLYDIAKLAHSVIGLYDCIIAGYFTAELTNQSLKFSMPFDPRRVQIIADFIAMMDTEFSVTEKQLYAMQIQLFISMLPLHDDRPDRQLGFIGNAYRLYDKMVDSSGVLK